MTILADKTYWKIGGLCENYYEVNSLHELLEVKQRLVETPIIIGNGTNILFDSKGYDGNVVKLGHGFNYFKMITPEIIEVGASTWVPGLVRTLSVSSLGGLEHCIGIPATIGGLVAMNGGSQRRSISENVMSVTILDINGEIKEIENRDCQFNYRNSIFKNSGVIILSVKLKLEKIKSRENRKVLLKILRERRNKFPRKTPNCGSVFLSSPELFEKIGPPGLIIENLGLKGMKCGDAQISSLHANFIVNNGSATSQDVLSLVREINNRCLLRYGMKMTAEVLYYSKDKKISTLDMAI